MAHVHGPSHSSWPQNLVGWWFVLDYMRTPPTHYYLKSNGRAAYMETNQQCELVKSTTVVGSLFQYIIIIFPLRFVTWYVHICHNPLVSLMDISFQHMWRWNREPSMVTRMWAKLISRLHILITTNQRLTNLRNELKVDWPKLSQLAQVLNITLIKIHSNFVAHTNYVSLELTMLK
jgi:hypothetical protein